MTKLLKSLIIALGVAGSSHALANDNVALSSNVFVEREVTKADGRTGVVLEQPSRVVPGDELVFVLGYRNVGNKPANDFVVTNPLPKAVAFRETRNKNALLSVDGGRSWGQLTNLTVATADGSRRAARPEDVTHIRWKFNSALASGSAGKLMFRGTVR